jgi:hypothetical protein
MSHYRRWPDLPVVSRSFFGRHDARAGDEARYKSRYKPRRDGLVEPFLRHWTSRSVRFLGQASPGPHGRSHSAPCTAGTPCMVEPNRVAERALRFLAGKRRVPDSGKTLTTAYSGQPRPPLQRSRLPR